MNCDLCMRVFMCTVVPRARDCLCVDFKARSGGSEGDRPLLSAVCQLDTLTHKISSVRMKNAG